MGKMFEAASSPPGAALSGMDEEEARLFGTGAGDAPAAALSDEMAGPVSDSVETSEAPTDATDESRLWTDVVEVVQADIASAKKLQTELEPKRRANYELWKGLPLGTEREGRSRVVSMDMLEAVESIMPSLMRIFFSGDEIVTFQPIGPEDERRAKLVTALLNYQFIHCNDGFVKFVEWCKSALVYGLSAAKVTWVDRFAAQDFKFESMTEQDFIDLSSDPNLEYVECDEASVPLSPEEIAASAAEQGLPPDAMPVLLQQMQMGMVPVPMKRVYSNVVGRRMVKTYSGPDINVVPLEDLFYDPEAKSMTDAKFVVHRVMRTVDYLKDMERAGIYRNVDEAVRTNKKKRDPETEAEKRDRYAVEGRQYPSDMMSDTADINPGREEVEVWEWWGQLDVKRDGRLQPYLVVLVGDTPIRVERNPYNHGEPPFEVLRPILDVDRFEGIGMGDLTGMFQRVKSSILRQTLDNLSFQNNGMWEVDRNGGVDMEALLNPVPGRPVRVDKANSIRPLTPAPLQGVAFQMLEMLQSYEEQRTGVTRYNQGLDARSLNKTATGITAILGASQQRLELMARMFAETGVKGLFRKMLSLNQQFLSDDFVVRIFNEPVGIAPDDISGRFDVVVSVAVGLGQREQTQMQMIQLLQMSPQFAQIGAMTPQNVYSVAKALLESWGYKDTAKYLTDPGAPQNMNPMMMQQMMQMMQQMLPQMLQQMLGGGQPPSAGPESAPGPQAAPPQSPAQAAAGPQMPSPGANLMAGGPLPPM